MMKRLAFYLTGILIFTLGIALCIKSEWGVGPWDAVFVAMHNLLPLTVGIWSIIVQVFLVLFTAMIEKRRPAYEVSITIIVRGLMLDFWLIFGLSYISFKLPYIAQIGIWTVGLLFLGIGIGMYILSELPKTPIDGFMIALQKRFNWSLKKARFIIEMSAAVLAFILAGPVGAGTIITAFTLAPIIQRSNQLLKKGYDKL
ncbi:YczE/YyaS/YitT family protein [Sporosarcina sp. FA9]|uniref:YczE/YyaS/YitT family protein n=1 Tax=Sporosarcina sp. FA9 TaxID=3413030 RepID=UPI003F655D84